MDGSLWAEVDDDNDEPRPFFHHCEKGRERRISVAAKP